MIRAWWLFKLADTAICPTAAATTLIIHDVFSFSRNPMCLGITMILGGLAMAVGALYFYAATMAFFVLMDRIFCPYEEQKSRQEFGASYVAYQKHVGRWL